MGEEETMERSLEAEAERAHLLEHSGVLDGSSRANTLTDSESGEVYFTVEDAIEKIGFGKFQLLMITYAGITWLADASEMILLSFVGPAAKCEWQLTPYQEGAISSAVFFGVFLGASCWGIVSDLKGRRSGFLLTAIFTLVFGILSAWSPTFLWLLLSRALVGFGLGGTPVSFSLCMEFLPPEGRGFWLVFLEVFWTLGSILEALLAWLIIPHMDWRVLVGVSALPFLILLVFFPILPESPQFLMVVGDVDGAMAVLKRIARVNKSSLPVGKLIQGYPSRVPLANPAKEKRGLPANIQLGVVAVDNDQNVSENSRLKKQNNGLFSTVKDLFSPELYISTILLWVIFFANAFTYYGLVLLTTELGVKGKERECGDNNNVPLDAAQCSANGRPLIKTTQYLEVLITCAAEFPGLVVACMIVDRLGRKISLASLLLACGVFMLPLWTPLSEVTTTILMFGARSSIMGAFSVLYVYAPELYHTKVRTTGLGAANSGGRLGGFLCPFVAVGLVESCHRVLAIGLFSIVPLAAGILSFFFPRETKGKKLSNT